MLLLYEYGQMNQVVWNGEEPPFVSAIVRIEQIQNLVTMTLLLYHVPRKHTYSFGS
jgi:hypothetical protein